MRRLVISLACMSLVGTVALAAPPTAGELAAWAPADAVVVVGMDTAALRVHPLVQSWLRGHQDKWTDIDDDSQEFLREAGLDPVRDVDAMMLSVLARAPEPRWLAFFSGRYDPVALGAALTKRNAEVVRDGDALLYGLRSEHGHGGGEALVHLSEDVVAIGDAQSMRAFLAGQFHGSRLLGDEIAAEHIDPTSEFWLVATVPDSARRAAAQAAQRHGERAEGALPGAIFATAAIRRVSAQFDLDKALRGQVWALADTPENAGLVRDAIKGALAALRLHAQDHVPELVDVLRSVAVDAAGPEVSVAGSVPLPVLERLLAQGHTCSAPQQ